jgi:hypothetical protein
MKICSNCHEKKTLEEFYKCNSRKDGRQNYCKTCLLDTTKRDYIKNNRKTLFTQRANERRALCKEYADNIKRENGCRCCDETEVVCLDFHHKDSEEKEHQISYLVLAKSMKKLIEEIKKCDVVCSNCHRKIHAGLITL